MKDFYCTIINHNDTKSIHITNNNNCKAAMRSDNDIALIYDDIINRCANSKTHIKWVCWERYSMNEI